ncbi:hypothetical protein PZA11_005116 [Diplocarpon coronariae]|uniref:Uncharacterized protein n=1 Tax=Diplocarpon coronariae TaxID=2795749 RepID=A0A218Z9Y9_9HELO|nr:hypothetical protein JHW43_002674 [Diplocarpon mali]OWP04524.1 hypothetical protein B2J93_1383 [Marssonina coronariae]
MASEKLEFREAGKKKETALSKIATKKTLPPATFKSQEFIIDSEDGDSESDEETSRVEPFKGVSKANGKLPAPSGSSSSSEGESESDDESNHDEDDSEGAAKSAPVIVERTERPMKESTKRTVSFEPPPPFHPPAGFKLSNLDEGSNVSRLLEKSSLEGKQIWYFTAPASIPISTIKEMSLSDAKDGKEILSYMGNSYGFRKDSTEGKTYTKIMVPSSSDDVYKCASESIDRVFHLQQIIRDPAIENTSKATIPAKKLVRKQPEGLRMRFKPIGFGAGATGRIGSASPEASDKEMEASLTMRRAPGITFSDEEMEETPPVTTKSHAKTKSSKSSAGVISEKGPSLKRKHSEERRNLSAVRPAQ